MHHMATRGMDFGVAPLAREGRGDRVGGGGPLGEFQSHAGFLGAFDRLGILQRETDGTLQSRGR